MREKHYCHQCGGQIAEPSTGDRIIVAGTTFRVIICPICRTEHQFITECQELVCHSTVRTSK